MATYECYMIKQNRFQKHERRINPNIREYFETKELAKERYDQMCEEIRKIFEESGLLKKLMLKFLGTHICAIMESTSRNY